MKMLPLARSVVDAAAHRRGDPSVIARAFEDPATRVLLMRDGRLATTGTGDAVGLDLRSPATLGAGGLRPDRRPGLWLFLGEHGGATFLAVLLDDVADGDAGPEGAGPEGVALAGVGLEGVGLEGVGLEGSPVAPGAVPADLSWSSLRDVGHLLADRDADLATTAVALGEWHRRTRRCPRCGVVTVPELGGWVRRCPVDGVEEHPRTDAAVIMAVIDHSERILLGHAAHWPERRFSTLAGFVEPGESLETAVRREVTEEVGLTISEVTYVASQPWPFPASLMVAFRARATTSDLVVDGQELTDARWFTRAELHRAVRDGEVLMPMRTSVALALIEQWYGGPLDVPPADPLDDPPDEAAMMP